MSPKIVLFSLISCIALSTANITNYEGCKVYEINAKNELEKKLIFELSANNAYDFFNLPKIIGKPAQVMVRPQDQLDFERTLTKYGIEYNVAHHNFQQAIELERAQSSFLRSIKSIIDFSTYHRHDKINQYLEKLATLYKNRVKVKTLGKSFENRDMKAIYITDGYRKRNKNVILVDAGIHAREWIAPAIALYIIHQLVEQFHKNRELLENYDWIVLPVVNPDGYEYSHTNDRLWRKTRQPHTEECIGTDANRNFDFHWGEIGSSNSACDNTYDGPYPFSEPESIVLRDLMLSVKERAKFYLTLHSYGSFLLYPWSWTTELPDTWKDIEEVANEGAHAIKKHYGRTYAVGTSPNLLYPASGCSDDYAYGKVGIPISITMELPQVRNSKFVLPPSEIIPVVKESWIGITAMAKKVIKKYGVANTVTSINSVQQRKYLIILLMAFLNTFMLLHVYHTFLYC